MIPINSNIKEHCAKPAEFTEYRKGKVADMSLNHDMKTSFFEIQLQHLKRRKKSPLTPKAADHILKNYKLMFHFDSPVSFNREICEKFMILFSESTPAELVEWMENLFL